MEVMVELEYPKIEIIIDFSFFIASRHWFKIIFKSYLLFSVLFFESVIPKPIIIENTTITTAYDLNIISILYSLWRLIVTEVATVVPKY